MAPLFGSRLTLNVRRESLALLAGRPHRRRPHVGGAALVPLSPSLLAEGVPLRESEVATALAPVLRERGWTRLPVRLALSAGQVLTRVVALPRVPRRAAHRALLEEAEQLLPISLADYYVDYRPLARRPAADGTESFLMAGVPKAQVEGWAAVLGDLGLTVECVDVHPNCAVRLLRELRPRDAALVDAGPGGVHVTLVGDGLFFLHADHPGWPPGTEGTAALGLTWETLRPHLEFFAARHFGRTVEAVFVTGELAARPGLCARLERLAGVPVWTFSARGSWGWSARLPPGFDANPGAWAVNLALLLR